MMTKKQTYQGLKELFANKRLLDLKSEHYNGLE